MSLQIILNTLGTVETSMITCHMYGASLECSGIYGL
jgi:hypothetical protein